MARTIRFGIAAVLTTALLSLRVSAQSYVNFEGKQTSPIRLSPDGKRLFAVNTPDARLSVFDVSNPGNPILISEIPVGLEPVSVNPRTSDEVWVVNEVSDSISVVSVSRHIVTDTIYVKDEPADVVFANGKAFVTASRNNQIVVFDATNHNVITNISVFGESPRAIAVNLDGTKVYAAFALSGNRTTFIPADRAPLQPTNATPPMSTSLPPPPRASLIVDAMDTNWTNIVKYTMPDNDIVEIDTTTHAINRYFSRVGTVNLALAVQPGSGNLFIANTDARNLVRFEPNVRGHIVTNRLSRINVTNNSITHFDLNPGINYSVMPNLAAKTNALAQPTAIAFGPSGSFAFVAAFGSDRVARINAADGTVLSRIEISSAPGSAVDPRGKRGPRGLALAPGGTQRLYVLNRISNTISVLDIGNNTVVGEIPVGSYDPTPAVIRQGRGFLYDTKLSGNGTASCASCHVDAEMDMIAWDLGDPRGEAFNIQTQITPTIPATTRTVHPMKGPMTTQTLRGLNGLDPLHWRGDRTNFLHFNGAFDSLLGGSLLSAADMQAYRAYINTIVFQPNPNQNLDRTYPTNFAGGNASAGRNTFFNEQYQPLIALSCTSCHTGPPGPGSDGLIFDRQALGEFQDFKVPHLRNLYQKQSFNNTNGAVSLGGFGLTHDGLDRDLFTFLSRSVFGTFANDTTRKRNLASFVLCFDTGTAPAVGYTRTVTTATVNSATISNDWSLLEAQARSTNVDLIVKGTLDGSLRGLLYQPGSNNYASDKTGATFTRAQLTAKIQSGDTLSIMGVPLGSGRRMGIERRQNGVLDGDVPAPALRIARAEPNFIVAWPTNANGFVLESAGAVSSTNWSVNPSAPGIVNSEFTVTNVGAASNLFFRLKQL